jgi:hypothetical protein
VAALDDTLRLCFTIKTCDLNLIYNSSLTIYGSFREKILAMTGTKEICVCVVDKLTSS